MILVHHIQLLKLHLIILLNAYYRTYGTPIIISNCSNNFGPWQYKEKLIPVIIKSIIENKSIPVYGNGKNEGLDLCK